MFAISAHENKLADAQGIPTELQGLRTRFLALRTYSVKR